MANNLFLAAGALWLLGGVVALFGMPNWSRAGLGLGCLAAALGAISALPGGGGDVLLPIGVAGKGVPFSIEPSAAWLLLFGALAALPATVLGSPARGRGAGWYFGAAASLIGALGVFGVQDGIAFLIAWELMSLGGAVMILSERLSAETATPVLFMLALLEVGSVALALAVLLLAGHAGGTAFASYPQAAASLSTGMQFWIGLLLLIGFGAKIGLLPFYEWFPQTYSAGSGASGALLSGIVLNAAFLGLARGLTHWIPLGDSTTLSIFDALVVVVAVLSTILTVLYAFQQEDWRALLSFSSAENGAIAVALLGASLVFARDGSGELAGLAWIVALLHLAGHALAKGAMFLCADGVAGAAGSYALQQTGLMRKSSWLLGVGAVFAGMSLAAMPPQAGFVSEWYMFQTMFNGFHLKSLGDRLLLVIAGAGLALTAAVALATFVKVLGIGLLGRGRVVREKIAAPFSVGVAFLGFSVLALAAGMPWWLAALAQATPPGYARDAAERMHDGWLLVPLTANFAFISPSKLVIAMPLLAVIPLALLLLSRARVQRCPVWYGGKAQDPNRASTTALAFSNALRTFYSFIYRPEVETTRELSRDGNGHPYFVRRLIFTHSVAPVFGPFLFRPAEQIVVWLSQRLRALQSGHLNFYLALIGLLLVATLIVALL
ncbi:MAG TPA: proton-conducting transporter membrane subunit [Rhizomicrobium sp.]|nr:proton-conducting transporter membrane subunit [Rhizomicrobium sp.]